MRQKQIRNRFKSHWLRISKFKDSQFSISKHFIILLLVFSLFPISVSASTMQAEPENVYVKNKLFLFSTDNWQLYELEANNTNLKESIETVSVTNNDYLILYTYAYGQPLKQFSDTSEEISNIAVKITEIMNCTKELRVQNDVPELPRKKMNILRLKDFPEGIYKVTVTTDTVAKDYSNFLYNVQEIDDVSNFYFSIGKSEKLHGHTETVFSPALYNDTELVRSHIKKDSYSGSYNYYKTYNVTLDSTLSFKYVKQPNIYYSPGIEPTIPENLSKLAYKVEETGDFIYANVGDTIKLSEIITEPNKYFLELHYLYDDGCLSESRSIIVLNVVE